MDEMSQEEDRLQWLVKGRVDLSWWLGQMLDLPGPRPQRMKVLDRLAEQLGLDLPQNPVPMAAYVLLDCLVDSLSNELRGGPLIGDWPGKVATRVVHEESLSFEELLAGAVECGWGDVEFSYLKLVHVNDSVRESVRRLLAQALARTHWR